jgi:hypothetical protein
MCVHIHVDGKKQLKQIIQEIFPIQRDIDDHIDKFEEIGIE